MTHGSLFSGIGGFDLAAQWCGWINVFQCEIDPFCRRVLKYHFPKTELYEDIKKTDFTRYAGAIDIISGGFPCQPFSNAGRRKGSEDDRYLWPEMLRVIQKVQPVWVVAENVPGLLSQERGVVFERVCADMEYSGYEVQPVIIPACAVGAPHRRDRIWLVAHRADAGIKDVQQGWKDGISEVAGIGQPFDTDVERVVSDTTIERLQGNLNFGKQKEEWEEYNFWEKPARCFASDANKFNGDISRLCPSETSQYKAPEIQCHSSDPTGVRCEQNNESVTSGQFKQNIPDWRDFPTQSPICWRNDGVPFRLGGITFSRWRNELIKTFGNAIVPQIAYEIFKIISKI
jgi:DNA (cytosine-5)-methyltransferase 1